MLVGKPPLRTIHPRMGVPRANTSSQWKYIQHLGGVEKIIATWFKNPIAKNRQSEPRQKATANRLQGPAKIWRGPVICGEMGQRKEKSVECTLFTQFHKFHPTRLPKCLFLRLQKRPWSRLVKPYSSQRLMDRIWSHHLGTMFKIGFYWYRHSTYLHAPFYNLNTTTNPHRKNDGLPGRPKIKCAMPCWWDSCCMPMSRPPSSKRPEQNSIKIDLDRLFFWGSFPIDCS